MNLFSISQLGRFSGLKPHTIRAWESRYQALRPSRSLGNTRYYDSSQMRRLLNMVSLVNAGYRASEVAPLTDEKLSTLLDTVINTRRNATEEYFISQLIAAGLSYDDSRFEEVFSQCLLRYRFKNTYQRILLPMMERIGLLWRCDKASPTQEHFVSNFLRRKFFSSIDSLPHADPGADRWLLFLPENEYHELGLLLAYNLIRFSGHQAIYLGANVPLSAMATAIRDIRPDRILMFTIQKELPRAFQTFLKEMETGFTGKKIYLAGNVPRSAKPTGSRKLQLLSSVDDLTGVLTSPEFSVS